MFFTAAGAVYHHCILVKKNYFFISSADLNLKILKIPYMLNLMMKFWLRYLRLKTIDTLLYILQECAPLHHSKKLFQDFSVHTTSIGQKKSLPFVRIEFGSCHQLDLEAIFNILTVTFDPVGQL